MFKPKTLLQQYYAEKEQKKDRKKFRLFLLAQLIQFAGLLVLLLGGVFLVFFGLKLFF